LPSSSLLLFSSLRSPDPSRGKAHLTQHLHAPNDRSSNLTRHRHANAIIPTAPTETSHNTHTHHPPSQPHSQLLHSPPKTSLTARLGQARTCTLWHTQALTSISFTACAMRAATRGQRSYRAVYHALCGQYGHGAVYRGVGKWETQWGRRAAATVKSVFVMQPGHSWLYTYVAISCNLREGLVWPVFRPGYTGEGKNKYEWDFPPWAGMQYPTLQVRCGYLGVGSTIQVSNYPAWHAELYK